MSSFEGYRVRRIDAVGRISTIAGTGKRGTAGDGGPALKAQLDQVMGLAVASDGALLIAEVPAGDGGHSRIRRLTPDGKLATVAGCAENVKEDLTLATKTHLNRPAGIALAPDGSCCFTERYRTRRFWPGVQAKDTVQVPSPDGSEVYQFTAAGRHVETRDALTGSLRWQFEYDAQGRLTRVVDGYGQALAIERDAKGQPTAIVSPYGQRTTLALDGNGYLSSVQTPGDIKHTCTYSAEGLLQTFTGPRGHTSKFKYDELGRLVHDQNAAGGVLALARQGEQRDFSVAVTTSLKPATTYSVKKSASGEEERLNQCCCGSLTQSTLAVDGTHRTLMPNGSIQTVRPQADPRFGVQSPLPAESVLTTPGGRTLRTSFERQVDLASSGDPLSLKTLTDRMTVNGREYVATYDGATRRATVRSPGGRESTRTFDAHGRLVKLETPGALPVALTYDDRGRLTKAVQGAGAEARVFSVGYDDRGRVSRATDALGREARYEYDPADRLIKAIGPDGREVVYAYDQAGNLTSLAPPGRPAHKFEHTSLDFVQSYTPPKIGNEEHSTRYEFDLDKKLTKIAFPGAQTVELAYDKVGHIESVTYPGGKRSYSFNAKTEQLESVTTADGGGLTFSYDGFLSTGTTWDGTIKGKVDRVYDNDFRVVSQTVNGGPAVPFKYDGDGLLVQAGELAFQRDAKTGFLKGSKLGKVSTTQEYNPFGERKRLSAGFDGKDLLVVDYERDAAGRIVKKTETIAGQTDIYVYGYDRAGRVADVTRNGQKVGHYEYDANGNRLKYEGQLGSFAASHDDQDRILQYGETTFTHTPNGEWKTKTVKGQTTSYVYDAFGNLRSVALPDGTKIDYLVDAANRRIGKKVNGKLVQGFLWQDQLKPIAELDGEGNIVSRFIYAGDVNVPAYLEKGGKTYRIFTDHLGSPRLVIDVASGEVAQRMDYDECGNVLADAKPGFQPFGFAGGIYDAQTKLIRFGARDYDATAARWTARDPILFDGSSANLYAYVRNNPINRRDAWGLTDATWGDTSISITGEILSRGGRTSGVYSRRIKGNEFMDKLGERPWGPRHWFVYDAESDKGIGLGPAGLGEEDGFGDEPRLEQALSNSEAQCVQESMKNCWAFTPISTNCQDCVVEAMEQCGLTPPWRQAVNYFFKAFGPLRRGY